MRLPAVDAFLSHHESVLEIPDAKMNNRTEPWKVWEKPSHIYVGLKLSFNLRVIQRILKIVYPIHILCEGRKETVGKVKVKLSR